MSKIKDELKARLATLNDGGKEKPIAPMIIRDNPTIKVELSELKAAIDTNPDHPIAKSWAKTTLKKSPPGKPVHVERADLQAVLDDKDVAVKVTIEDGDDDMRVKVARKVLVPRKKETKPAATKPATEPKEPAKT